MYDMYPWSAAADGPRGSAPQPRSDSAPQPRSDSASAPKPRDGNAPLATAAVQVALDRRDSGGEAADDEYPVTFVVAGRK